MKTHADVLHDAFPWLGTDDDSEIPDSGADVIQDLELLYRRLRAEEAKPAMVKRGKLVCPKCGPSECNLREHGYIVDHTLESIKRRTITAEGWDGNSRGISEDGDRYVLECQGCFAEYPVPANFVIDWV